MWKSKLLSAWVYFRHGHGTYLLFLLSFVNFVTIQYAVLIHYIPNWAKIFPSIIHFALILIIIYVPLATLLGYLDYRLWSVPRGSEFASKASPYSRDLAKALELMAEGRNEEAAELLKKWTKSL